MIFLVILIFDLEHYKRDLTQLWSLAGKIYRSVSYQAATWLLSCGGAGRSGSKLRLSAAATAL